MTDNLPDYMELEPPAGVDPQDYSAHERRAAILREIIDAGSPGKIRQCDLADRYEVHPSTISRDMDRLRESIDDVLGRDAKLTSKAVFERVLGDLLEEEDWRAKARAFELTMRWNEFLADIGEQHREPTQSELDVRSRNAEVSYQVVRDEPDDPLPTLEDGSVDYEELGFADGPSQIDVEATDESDSE